MEEETDWEEYKREYGIETVEGWKVPAIREQKRHWDKYIKSERLKELVAYTKERSLFSAEQSDFLVRMSAKLEKEQELTVDEMEKLLSLLRLAKQKGLLPILDEPISNESTRSAPGMKEPPRDAELHRRIGSTQADSDGAPG